jgi:hypothetical protein
MFVSVQDAFGEEAGEHIAGDRFCGGVCDHARFVVHHSGGGGEEAEGADLAVAAAAEKQVRTIPGSVASAAAMETRGVFEEGRCGAGSCARSAGEMGVHSAV